MRELSPRQATILEFIESLQRAGAVPPTLREIADHFGFRSVTAAANPVRALRHKGFLVDGDGRRRTLRAARPLGIPIFGSIPAGFPDAREQQAEGRLGLDMEGLGLKPTPRTFALRVRGDSMTGRHIVDGDIVVLEHGVTPRHGDVVAALIDGESTLKTFVLHRGKPCLKAENPKYPDLVPVQELVIQGVMKALVRSGRR